MIIDFSKFTVSDYAAWWGAIIATFALVWNIIVAARSGARVRVHVKPDMEFISKQPVTGDKTYILVTAVNRGTSPTTITHFCGYYSQSWWDLVMGKKQKFLVQTHPLGEKVPYVLAPGKEWRGVADQEGVLKHAKGGFLYLGIIHNQKKKPVYKRVKVNATV